MEISKEQVELLRNELGEKKLKEMGIEIEIPIIYNRGKIYAFNGGNIPYKLNKTNDGYVWSSIDDTGYCLRHNKSAEEALEEVLSYNTNYEIEEFDNLKDFAKWLSKVSK